jgi:hypothetical protein
MKSRRRRTRCSSRSRWPRGRRAARSSARTRISDTGGRASDAGLCAGTSPTAPQSRRRCSRRTPGATRASVGTSLCTRCSRELQALRRRRGVFPTPTSPSTTASAPRPSPAAATVRPRASTSAWRSSRPVRAHLEGQPSPPDLDRRASARSRATRRGIGGSPARQPAWRRRSQPLCPRRRARPSAGQWSGRRVGAG